MTRARNELQLCAPLKFPLTQQPKNGDLHVYGGAQPLHDRKSPQVKGMW
jgi:hypothetical protein